MGLARTTTTTPCGNHRQSKPGRVLDRFIPLRPTRPHPPPDLDEDDGEEAAERQCILEKVLYDPRTRAYRHHLEKALFGRERAARARVLQLWNDAGASGAATASGPSWRHWPSRARGEPLSRAPLRKMWLSDMPKGRRRLHQLVAWGACGILAVACRRDVYLWREAGGAGAEGATELLVHFGNRSDAVVSLCWSASPDEPLLIIGQVDHRVQVWDCHKREQLMSRMLPDRAPAHTVSWHPSRDLIALGTVLGNVHLLNKRLVLLRSVCVFPDPLCGVSKLAFSRDGSLLACGGLGGSVVVWDWERDTTRSDEVDTRSTVTSLSWHPWRRSMLAVGSLAGDVIIMDFSQRFITQAKYRGKLGYSADVTALSFSPKTAELVVAFNSKGATQIAVLTDLTTVVDRLEEHEDPVNYLCWSPDGTTLATAGSDNVMCLWNFMGAKKTRELKREALREAREARSGIGRRFGCVIR